jgi:hypothetical protein
MECTSSAWPDLWICHISYIHCTLHFNIANNYSLPLPGRYIKSDFKKCALNKISAACAAHKPTTYKASIR